MASRCEDGTVTGDFLDELPNFHIDTFSQHEEHSERFAEVSEVMLKNSMKNKKNCLLCRNFVSSCKINRTLYGRLGDTNFIFKQFGLVVWYSVMV